MTPEQARERARGFCIPRCEYRGAGVFQSCENKEHARCWEMYEENVETTMKLILRVADEAQQEERKRCEEIVGRIQPAFIRDEILRRLKEP